MRTLYRFYDAAGVLLYIGLTAQPGHRMVRHRRFKDWWLDVARIEVEHFSDILLATEAERLAIMSEAPLYNVVHNREPVLVQVDGRTYSERHSRRILRGK